LRLALIVRHAADFIAGQQAEMKMNNAREIGQERADAIHTPAIVQRENGLAMGASQLFAADTVMAESGVQVANVMEVYSARAATVRDAAASNLLNARVRAGMVIQASLLEPAAAV
jgi:hypothetical protein